MIFKLFVVPLRLCYPITLQNHCREGYIISREVIMEWKHISTLYQIYVPFKENVGECIDGGKYLNKTYMEALTI